MTAIQYGKAPPKWARCRVCGLTASDVVDGPGPVLPRCADPERCGRMQRGEPLGGKSWGPIEAWQPAGDDPPRVPWPERLGPPPPADSSWRDFEGEPQRRLGYSRDTARPVHVPFRSWEEEQFLFAQSPGIA